MISGRLDRRITLQYRSADSPAQDAAGEPQYTWTDSDVWAEMASQKGRELFAAGKISERGVVWNIRYNSSVDTTWRVVYDSQTYDITAVNEIGRQRGLELVTDTVN